MACVYIAKAEAVHSNTILYKIGCTSWLDRRRVGVINGNMYPFADVALYYSWDMNNMGEAKRFEEILHDLFRYYAVGIGREWFDLPDAVLKFMVSDLFMENNTNLMGCENARSLESCIRFVSAQRSLPMHPRDYNPCIDYSDMSPSGMARCIRVLFNSNKHAEYGDYVRKIGISHEDIDSILYETLLSERLYLICQLNGGYIFRTSRIGYGQNEIVHTMNSHNPAALKRKLENECIPYIRSWNSSYGYRTKVFDLPDRIIHDIIESYSATTFIADEVLMQPSMFDE